MRGKTVIIIGALALLIGAAVALLMTSDAAPETEALIPANSFLYVDGSLELEGNQRRACDDLAGRFPELDDCTSLGDKVSALVDEELAEEDMTFEDDVAPWLGDDFALFMTTEGLSELIRESQQPAEFDLASFEENSDLGARSTQVDNPSPVVGLLMVVEDENAARSFLEQGMEDESETEVRSYEGVDYFFTADGAWAVFDGHIVLGTEVGLKAVVDQRSAEESLEDVDRFTTAMASARSDRLGVAYLDLKPLLEAAFEGSSPQVPPGFFGPFLEAADRPVTITAHLEERGLAIETSSAVSDPPTRTSPPAGGLGALRSLPPDAWGALGVESVADPIRGFLEMGAAGIPGGREALEGQFRRQTGLDLEQDVLSWMGSGAFFVGGRTEGEVFGGMTIETSDPTGTARTILQLERLLARDNPTEIITRSGFRGFVVKVPERKQVGVIAVDKRRAVAAMGPLSLLDELSGDRTLGDTERFAAAQESLGDGFTMGGFLDADMIRTFIEDSMPGDDVYEKEVRPYLEPLEHLVFGSQAEDGVTRDRFVIGVE